MSGLPPAWVLQKVRELSIEEDDRRQDICQVLCDLGYTCTVRQVKRWQKVHKIRKSWRGTDAELDALIRGLHAADELGPKEGYKWLHSVVNKALPVGVGRVGKARVQKALARCFPAGRSMHARPSSRRASGFFVTRS